MTAEKELFELGRIAWGIERYSEENDSELDRQLESVEELLEEFNRKYPSLFIKVHGDSTECRIRVFINETSVRKIFDEVASKLPGLTFIGLSGFQEAGLQQEAQFAALVEEMGDEVFLTYSKAGTTETIHLAFDKKLGKVELELEPKELIVAASSQAQLLLKYMKKGDKSVHLLEKAYLIGFSDIDDKAHFEWEDKFHPKHLE
ncbi:MAG: hypothetical protein Q7S65_03800 [Nanoarchaeota archaeon]|nr:hypothetical protein [Nanoarchaeota archaeon]